MYYVYQVSYICNITHSILFQLHTQPLHIRVLYIESRRSAENYTREIVTGLLVSWPVINVRTYQLELVPLGVRNRGIDKFLFFNYFFFSFNIECCFSSCKILDIKREFHYFPIFFWRPLNFFFHARWTNFKCRWHLPCIFMKHWRRKKHQ